MATDNDELSEKDFIQEGYKKNPVPFWIWFFIIVIAITMIFGLQSFYSSFVEQSVSKSPFMQVTNRDFSLFLWQNPEYMRANARTKSGYLVGFQYIDSVTIEPGFEEKYVVASPDVLFRYHVWERLVKNEVPERNISSREFVEFLEDVPEWKPDNWAGAPQRYKEMMETLPLSTSRLNELPQDVKIAFIGWKNFYKEGTEINNVKPTVEELQKFLARYPHYARNYWKNLVSEDYLKDMISNKGSSSQPLPSEQLAPFLKAAYYNFAVKR